MKIKHIEKQEVEVTTDVICDCCGKSCRGEGSEDVGLRDFQFMQMEAHWGYFSENKDMQKWTAQICEKCVDEKFSFVKFKKERYLNDI